MLELPRLSMPAEEIMLSPMSRALRFSTTVYFVVRKYAEGSINDETPILRLIRTRIFLEKD